MLHSFQIPIVRYPSDNEETTHLHIAQDVKARCGLMWSNVEITVRFGRFNRHRLRPTPTLSLVQAYLLPIVFIYLLSDV